MKLPISGLRLHILLCLFFFIIVLTNAQAYAHIEHFSVEFQFGYASAIGEPHNVVPEAGDMPHAASRIDVGLFSGLISISQEFRISVDHFENFEYI